ncbi:uncharacterized protein EHS24_003683 [Apiotrichum porosum]|uniref:Uncharacterized protein n=1 Tax=Apiotrichum porosum TaxID=105984 RepID=A0A427XDT3_9TREE|nr:uncharacterized protein EHS24_003683 [Apiotrichum porosum]RSH77059.1 hypothetical protein EHS24_003683 [Apiotrichum porosum]
MSTSTATSPQLPATAAPVPSQHANQVQQIQQTPTTSWKDQIYLVFSVATLGFLFYGSVAAAGGSFAAVTLFAYKLK